MPHQILVLMAGIGSRVESLEQGVPKPLIKIHGHTLISIVIKNLRSFKVPVKFIFVCQSSHYNCFNFKKVFDSLDIDYKVVLLDGPTNGAAISALNAYQFLDDGLDLTIANSDQFFLHSFDSFLSFSRNSQSKGTIMSMHADGKQWSFIKLNSYDFVQEVQEKLPVSNLATVGLYYFKSPRIFHDAVSSMVSKQIKTCGEFYLAPCYNEIIASGLTVNHYLVGELGIEVFGLGTAEDINFFESLPNSKKILNLL